MYIEQQFQIPPFTGLTEQSINEHKKLYAGYVKQANGINEKLDTYAGDETKVYETGELYRRFSFEYNGMRNHECYFKLLTGATEISTNSTLHKAIDSQWESIETFKKTFTTLALTRGIGWAMLSFDHNENKLIMHWIDEQHLGQLQGTTAIIALDMWEHSYVADYQPSGKKQYITDFIDQINWTVAEENFVLAQ